MPVITTLGSFAAGSTPVYNAQIVDQFGAGIPATSFTLLTLSIVDSLTGLIINGVDRVNILNVGRGTIDATGNLTITLQAGDTDMSEVPGAPQVQRSMIIDWTYNPDSFVGRHQVNFTLLALSGR